MEVTMAQGWSSLPADLVNRVPGCLLATNDLDHYMNLRAVCQHWRSSRADPRINQHHPRFLPSRWVMLNEHESLGNRFLEKKISISSDGSCLFVNTATGRYIRKNLPLLRNYMYITTTTGDLLVLSARDSPHLVRVLSPFTGSLISFATPMPAGRRLTATMVVVGSTPTLVLASIVSDKVYRAEPQSKSFSVEWHLNSAARRLPMIALGAPIRYSNANNVCYQLLSEKKNRCHVAETAAGDLLAVLERVRHGMSFIKIDAAGNVLERLKSIGNIALFLGYRCLVVDVDKFPSVEANCVYFQVTDDPARVPCIYKFNIEAPDTEEELELVTAAMGRDDMVWCSNLPRPFTIIQLLSNYTMDIRLPLKWERRTYLKSCVEIDYYDECNYIDYVDWEERGEFVWFR